MQAIVFTGTGDASILRVVDLPPRSPGPGEVRIRVTSAGLNRADANYRAGKYLLRTQQLRLQGYTLGPMLADPARRARAVDAIRRHLERRDFAPVVDSYYPLDAIQEAHRRLESNRQIGKVVVTP